MFPNNDKCTKEINWNTESKIKAENFPGFQLSVAEHDAFMSYAVYANPKPVVG